MNGPDQWRYGAEFEIETASYRHFSLAANYTYVYINQEVQAGDDLQIANLICRYLDDRNLTVELIGNWLWRPTFDDANRQNDMLWDLAVTKHLPLRPDLDLALFAKVRNLFNSSLYWGEDYPNPRRWVEAGLRFRF